MLGIWSELSLLGKFGSISAIWCQKNSEQILIRSERIRSVPIRFRSEYPPHSKDLKYMPFKQVDYFLILEFNIPTQVSLSPLPTSTTTQPTTVQTVPSFSLQASSSYHPAFAGLSINQGLPQAPSPTPQHILSPEYRPSACVSSHRAVGAAGLGMHRHPDVMSGTSGDVVFHGGVDPLPQVYTVTDTSYQLNNDVDIMLQLEGDADDAMINWDVGKQAVNTNGGDPIICSRL